MAVLQKGLGGRRKPCRVESGCAQWRKAGLAVLLYMAAAITAAAETAVSATARPSSEIATYPENRALAVVVPQNDSKPSAEFTASLYAPLQTP